jgi:hypothetical protein
MQFLPHPTFQQQCKILSSFSSSSAYYTYRKQKFYLSEILPIPISTKNRIYLSEIDPNIFYKTEFFFGIYPKSPSSSPLKEKERVYF